MVTVSTVGADAGAAEAGTPNNEEAATKRMHVRRGNLIIGYLLRKAIKARCV
jgi:hypothetical protein